MSNWSNCRLAKLKEIKYLEEQSRIKLNKAYEASQIGNVKELESKCMK